MNITKYLEDKKALFDNELDKLVSSNKTPCKQLADAARYSLLNGGKRIRPILALATCEMFKGNIEDAIVPGIAIELIHTYSLIHDDLPCMDDDDFRRGKPTLHKVYSEAQALLTGDLLLTKGFELLADSPNINEGKKIDLIKTLANSAGIDGMIGGQSMDIESDNNVDIEHLQQIHQYKTGALIKASFEFGAIIASATKEERDIINSFARDIGLIFQIIDDILDVTASVEKRGQILSSDVKNQKSTYATLFGPVQAKEKALSLLNDALHKLSSLNCDTSLLQNLSEYIVNRKI